MSDKPTDPLTLPAGPELDALVAGRVIGWGDGRPPYHGFTPSADFGDTWKVVEAATALSLRVVIEDWRDDTKNPGWAVYFFRQSGGSSKQIVAETLPLAVCRAALLAVAEGASS